MSSEAPQDAAAEADKADKAKEYYDQLLRLKAEFENYRKRVDREKPEFVSLGRAEVLLKLLPIYDMLRSAHQQIQGAHAQSEFAKGMEGIFKEFEKIFKEEGVRLMEPLGKPYDPLAHEVLGTVEKDEEEDGAVVEVLQDGFMLQDKVLRTAKVRIARKEKKS
jgi:molecular chaperone GrpE